MEDRIRGPNIILETIIDKGLLLPALSYSWWMPVEAKVTYRISEILIDLKKIPDNLIFHYVDKTNTQEWEDAVYEIDHPVLGKGQIKRNNKKENQEDSWSLDIPKGKGKTKFVQNIKTKDWYILSILLYYEDPLGAIEQLHLSIVSVQNKTPRELLTVMPLDIGKPLSSLKEQYPLRQDAKNISYINLNRSTVAKILSAISPHKTPLIPSIHA